MGTIIFSVDLGNVASVGNGNNIPSVTAPSENFVFHVQLSDGDIGNGGTDSLMLSRVQATITSGDVTQGLVARASATTFTGTADVTFNTVQCSSVQYMCIDVTPGIGSVYTDVDTTASSNTICTDVSSYILCAPGMTLTSINTGRSSISHSIVSSLLLYSFLLDSMISVLLED